MQMGVQTGRNWPWRCSWDCSCRCVTSVQPSQRDPLCLAARRLRFPNANVARHASHTGTMPGAVCRHGPASKIREKQEEKLDARQLVDSSDECVHIINRFRFRVRLPVRLRTCWFAAENERLLVSGGIKQVFRLFFEIELLNKRAR